MKVIAVIPRAGLGNRLLVWARALIFAHLNKSPLYIVGLNKLHIGPLLRGEKSKRFYINSFRFRLPIRDYYYYIKAYIKTNSVIIEPEIIQYNSTKKNLIVIFNKIPDWRDYFYGLKDHRDYIKLQLLKIINKNLLKKYSEAEVPHIGIHIRMGDFRKINHIEDMKFLGLARTPIAYFIECIEKIRELKREQVPVTIFSDGNEDELSEILKLPYVKLYSSGNDLADLLILSKSKIIITSQGSTFSYWAAFLSDAYVIYNPYDTIKFDRYEEGSLEDFLNSIKYNIYYKKYLC